MKSLNSRVSTVGIFFASTVLLIGYLLSIRWNIYLPVPLFWLAIVLVIGTVVYQCFRFKLSSGYAAVVAAEFAVACVALHLIHQIPYYGLYGTDAYGDMASAQGILSSGFVMGAPEHITGYSPWPMIHILGAELSLVTDIDLFAVVKWFPSFMGAALVLLLYLLVRKAFRDEKAALLSALSFVFLQQYMLFGSLFIRETIALVLMICCLHLYFSARASPHPAACYALSVMCLAGTTFAHHFTSFTLALFLLVHFLVARIASLPALKKRYFPDGIVGQKVGVVFLILAIALPVAFWTTGGIQAPAGHPSIPGPIARLLEFLRNLFSPDRWGSGYADMFGLSFADIQTPRGIVLFFGFWFFIAVFGAILLRGLLPGRTLFPLEKYSYTIFLFACGLVGFLGLYVVPMTIFPDRLLTFGFLFGFPPLVIAVLHYRRRWLRSLGIGFLAAFMLFNVFWIDPTAWDARAEGMPAAPSQQDYALAGRFDFRYGEVAGHPNSVMAIYHVHNNHGWRVHRMDKVSLEAFDWVIVPRRWLELEMKRHDAPRTEIIAQLHRLMEEGSQESNKIYESDAVAAFKRMG